VRNRIPALLALLICLPLVAGGNLFRWRDADGKLHIGDSLPAEAIQKGYDIIDERGRVLKHVDPPPSPEELRKRREAARKAELERQRRVAQAERDRALLLTYGSVAEIERARDERLNLIRSQIRVNRDRENSAACYEPARAGRRFALMPSRRALLTRVSGCPRHCR